VSTGPSSSTQPYILARTPNVRLASIVTSGDPLPADGVFAGQPDGIGAFDNGDGTMTVLVAHHLGPTAGLVRDHRSTGSYIDRLVVDKATLQVLTADDLIKSVRLWDDANDRYISQTTQFARMAAGELAPVTSLYNASSHLGTDVQICFIVEESGTEGRAFATVVGGPNAGVSYELPYFGNMNYENALANPLAQDKTIVAITDDTIGGEVYLYVGQKGSTGTEIDKAGLSGGQLYGIKVAGIVDEANGTPANGSFTLVAVGAGGDVSNMTGAALQTDSDSKAITGFLRPEDGAWDPDNPNVFYFVTTATFTGNSRLYKLTFTDISRPELGGTITAVLDGSEGQRMFDNMTLAGGKIILQEDPGNTAYIAKIWEYDIATDTLVAIASFDPAHFTPGASGFITQYEESSGVVDVSSILGDSDTRVYLLDAQVHRSTGSSATIEYGQLLAMYVDQVSPVRVTFNAARDTSVHEGTPDLASAAATTLYIDGGAGTQVQALLAFDNLFGSGPGQIPVGATVTSAMLTLKTFNGSADGATLHRMLTGWTDQATWNSLGAGVQLGTEAVTAADVNSFGVAAGTFSYDVTASLNAWLSGAASAADANAANRGWVFMANSTDGWDFLSSESSGRPVLTVTYLPPANNPPVAVNDSAATQQNKAVTVNVLLNDSDPDGNALSVTAVGSASHGTAVIQANGSVLYTPSSNYVGSDSFSYTISDGNGGTASATVAVTVTAPPPPQRTTVTFQQGSSYSGTVDTYVDQGRGSTVYGSVTKLQVDSGGGREVDALLAFTNLFGTGAGQIPPGATIVSATLTLSTVNGSTAGGSLHRMQIGWNGQSTWDSLGNGIQLGTEAASASDLNTGSVSVGTRAFDVTASLQAWLGAADPNAANHGWVFMANSTDGWDFSSSENATGRPLLTVTYEMPAQTASTTKQMSSASALAPKADSGLSAHDTPAMFAAHGPDDLHMHAVRGDYLFAG
jgi:hypothetical protein